jgi:acetylornithine deacetylase/succinyl-diaminopimelate desuccinylase-like protein
MAAQIYAVLQLAREASSLNGTLVFAATADEERGGTHGVQYLLKTCPEKLRADFVVNEGGEGPRTINGREIYFVQVGEKGTAWSRLQAAGYSCHGSVPTMGDNAVLKMARALVALGSYQPGIKMIPEVRFLLQELIRLKGLQEPLTEANVDALLDKFTDRSFAETLRAMTRMTVSPNSIAGGSKTNIVPDECMADVDIRILPGQDRDYVFSELQRCIGKDIAIEIRNYAPPTFSSSQLAPYKLIAEVTQELAGKDTLCLPHISPGATDSRYLREAGIPSYGIGHMAKGSDPELGATIHGKNERIDIASLYFRADFFLALARRYLC